MYSHVLGRALNYGQSMVPGRDQPKSKNVKRAVLAKRRKKAPVKK